MRNEQPILLALPRFSLWMKRIAIALGTIWLALVVLTSISEGLSRRIIATLRLIPDRVLHGAQIWRLITYPVVEDPGRWGAIVWTMLGLWLIGSPVERMRGPRALFEVMGSGVLGGAIAAIVAGAISKSHALQPVIGMSPVTASLVVGWGFAYARERVTFFGMGPLPGWQLALGISAIGGILAFVSQTTESFATVGAMTATFAWMWFRGRGPKSMEKEVDEILSKAAKRARGDLRVIRGGRADDDKLRWN